MCMSHVSYVCDADAHINTHAHTYTHTHPYARTHTCLMCMTAVLRSVAQRLPHICDTDICVSRIYMHANMHLIHMWRTYYAVNALWEYCAFSKRHMCHTCFSKVICVTYECPMRILCVFQKEHVSHTYELHVLTHIRETHIEVSNVFWGMCVTRVWWEVQPIERWGAGVETHFQEISWNLRPVVNGT